METIQLMNPEREVHVHVLHSLVRKYAHLFLYTVLGMLFLHALRIGSALHWQHIRITLLFGAVYAISDEVHQLFVPGRGAQLQDVVIDLAGVVLGIVIYGAGLKVWKVIISRRESIRRSSS